MPWLSVNIWLPIFGGLLLLLLNVSKKNGLSAQSARVLALVLASLLLLCAVPLISGFSPDYAQMQFVEKRAWITRYTINYHLGIDGISIWLLVLNNLITFLVVLSTKKSIKGTANYYALFLLMAGLVNGVFCALDAVLFYVLWEATLIPLFFVIGIWGGEGRAYAAIKFFLFTLFGSLLMLIALIYLYQVSGSFSLLEYHDLPLGMSAQIWLFIAFLVAFAVKIPMVPVHIWLPDAHVEAPTGGSMILAAVMLKLGAYGLLRFSLPITPDASVYLADFMIALSLVAIIYISLVALVQPDMKKLVAYSSVAHMGFVTLGIFLFDIWGATGAVVQMISHGFVSAAMFYCIGVMYDRMHTRKISDYGGVAKRMPKYSAFLMLFAMANAGLPATSGFVGEFLVIMATVRYDVLLGILAATSLITGAAYTLWMYKRVIFGKIVSPEVAKLVDVGRTEKLVLGLFAFFVLLIGIVPVILTDLMHSSLNELLIHVAQGKVGGQ